MSGRVEGKVVVITGAAGGQGAAAAALLAAEGAVVVATDISDAGGCHRLDVSRPDEWQALAETVRADHGRVDGLVNNAGTSHRERLLEVTLDDFNRVLAVNLTGALIGIQTFAPLMTAGGSVVNIGSAAAVTAPYAVAYTVSKWGLRGLTRVASMELGALGIRVNLVNPGFIATPMTAGLSAAVAE